MNVFSGLEQIAGQIMEIAEGKEMEPTRGKEKWIPRFRSSPFTASNRGASREGQPKI